MRIIAGEFRGRKLLAPEGDATRPITDRVKQSLFDILMPIVPDAVVYDCFAGTGSMGLECLSRGAGRVTFFESDRSALSQLEKNIATLKVADRAIIARGDIFKLLTRGPLNDAKATLVFLDPPYRFLRERPAELISLVEDLNAKHLAPEATLVFRHDAADTLALPMTKTDERTYGGMTLEFLKPNV